MHIKQTILRLYSFTKSDDVIKLIKYMAVGTFNAVLGFTIYVILTELCKIQYIISNSIVAIIYLCGSFLMNNYWVFISKSRRKLPKTFSRFLLVYLFDHLFDTVLLLILTEIVGIPYFVSKGINIMLISVLNYFVFMKMVF